MCSYDLIREGKGRIGRETWRSTKRIHGGSEKKNG
jgi:hypothetical protein